MILAIDFDKVIHDKANPVPGRRMGPPFADSQAAMQTLYNRGHELIIHTVMAQTPGGRKAVEDWMKYYEIPFTRIEPKITADYYIDDKAIRHTSWPETLAEMGKVGPL